VYSVLGELTETLLGPSSSKNEGFISRNAWQKSIFEETEKLRESATKP
jgi:hypothetical protein